jgi:hypothetical protein
VGVLLGLQKEAVLSEFIAKRQGCCFCAKVIATMTSLLGIQEKRGNLDFVDTI